MHLQISVSISWFVLYWIYPKEIISRLFHHNSHSYQIHGCTWMIKISFCGRAVFLSLYSPSLFCEICKLTSIRVENHYSWYLINTRKYMQLSVNFEKKIHDSWLSIWHYHLPVGYLCLIRGERPSPIQKISQSPDNCLCPKHCIWP